MNLTRRSTPTFSTNTKAKPRVVGSLRMLNVSFVEGEGFWLCNAGRLHWILADAKKAYKKAIFKSHPDRGGSLEETAMLNTVWNYLKRKFKERLNRSI